MRKRLGLALGLLLTERAIGVELNIENPQRGYACRSLAGISPQYFVRARLGGSTKYDVTVMIKSRGQDVEVLNPDTAVLRRDGHLVLNFSGDFLGTMTINLGDELQIMDGTLSVQSTVQPMQCHFIKN